VRFQIFVSARKPLAVTDEAVCLSRFEIASLDADDNSQRRKNYDIPKPFL